MLVYNKRQGITQIMVVDDLRAGTLFSIKLIMSNDDTIFKE